MAKSKSNTQRAAELAQRIARQVARAAGKGLDAGRIFLTGRVKEALSVPAPRAPIRGKVAAGRKKGPIIGYRATEPATPGAPPRKLTGRLRSSVSSYLVSPTVAVIGTNARSLPSRKYPKGFNYPKYHEIVDPGFARSGQHPFIRVTSYKWRGQIRVIVGGPVRTELLKEARGV